MVWRRRDDVTAGGEKGAIDSAFFYFVRQCVHNKDNSVRRYHVTAKFNALPAPELIGAPTPLEYLPRLSDHLGREIFY